MDTLELLGKMRESISAGRSFGPAHEADGCTVIPVAWVAGGGGAGTDTGLPPKKEGQGNGETGTATGPPRTGSGGGFGFVSVPMGAYVIKNGEVRWVPSFDLGLLALIITGFLKSLAKVRARRLKA